MILSNCNTGLTSCITNMLYLYPYLSVAVMRSDVECSCVAPLTRLNNGLTISDRAILDSNKRSYPLVTKRIYTRNSKRSTINTPISYQGVKTRVRCFAHLRSAALRHMTHLRPCWMYALLCTLDIRGWVVLSSLLLVTQLPVDEVQEPLQQVPGGLAAGPVGFGQRAKQRLQRLQQSCV